LDYGPSKRVQLGADAVATAAELALFAESPKRRYVVTPDQEQAMAMLKIAVSIHIAEMNDYEKTLGME